MITNATVYKTSDGKLHEDRLDALKHEFSLDVRGLIHRSMDSTRAGANLSTLELSQIIVKNCEKFAEIISKNKTAIGRANRVKAAA